MVYAEANEILVEDLGLEGQIMVRKVLESLTSLIQVTLYKELIEVATVFWNEKRLVFRFRNVKMTLLLEKIIGYAKDINLVLKRYGISLRSSF